MLQNKDLKIEELQRENYALKNELRETNSVCKEAKTRLEGIESRHTQQVYELKLQLESKARLQMVCPADRRRRMRASCRLHTLTRTRTKRPRG